MKKSLLALVFCFGISGIAGCFSNPAERPITVECERRIHLEEIFGYKITFHYDPANKLHEYIITRGEEEARFVYHEKKDVAVYDISHIPDEYWLNNSKQSDKDCIKNFNDVKGYINPEVIRDRLRAELWARK